MGGRIVGIVAVCAGLAAGLALFMLARSEDEAGRPPAVAAQPEPEAPAAPPAGAPTPEVETPAARPAPAPSGGRAGRETPAPRVSDAMPAPGTLRVETDVPGAMVFVDRRFIGRAPVTAESLTPGSHQVTVSAEGFDAVSETIEVEPGARELTISLREVRLDASIPVVHKHRFGSCSGTLVATPAGIRFESDNPGDAFSAGLDDLESFQVDYQERNLRVKVRGGREYNFTDPEGSADRLFVFHRDVDRARERLGN